MGCGITVHNLKPVHFVDTLEHGLSLSATGGKDLPLQLTASPRHGRSADLLPATREPLCSKNNPDTLKNTCLGEQTAKFERSFCGGPQEVNLLTIITSDLGNLQPGCHDGRQTSGFGTCLPFYPVNLVDQGSQSIELFLTEWRLGSCLRLLFNWIGWICS